MLSKACSEGVAANPLLTTAREVLDLYDSSKATGDDWHVAMMKLRLAVSLR